MNEMRKFALGVVAAMSLVAACGGGGGGGAGGSPANPPQPALLAAPPLAAISYANAKNPQLEPLSMPAEAMGSSAYARANFKGDGNQVLFIAYATYDPAKPLADAKPGVFSFWTQGPNGTWLKDDRMIDTPVGCMVPRKAVVADFNRDGRADVLVACHGYDAAPFPGERSFLVESTPSGVYKSHPVNDAVGFFHGAAAADLDGDGLIDYVATDGGARPLRFFKNMGNSTFTEQTGKFPATLHPGYFTVEVLDVNEDGKLDILAGGHEFAGAATVLLPGDGSGNFTITKSLPAASTGVVLDFVKVGTKLFVGRTSQPYSMLGIQAIDLATNAATETSKASLLFYWLLPKGSAVVSDRTDRPL
jgi:hypothetical protein